MNIEAINQSKEVLLVENLDDSQANEGKRKNKRALLKEQQKSKLLSTLRT